MNVRTTTTVTVTLREIIESLKQTHPLDIHIQGIPEGIGTSALGSPSARMEGHALSITWERRPPQ